MLAGSYLDSILAKYLEYSMRTTGGAKELFESNGPLASFSQRIKIARAFTLMPSSHADLLDIVRRIRNHFAHHPLEASFDKSPIREWADILGDSIGNLSEGKISSGDRRSFYLYTTAVVACSMHVTMEKDDSESEGV